MSSPSRLMVVSALLMVLLPPMQAAWACSFVDAYVSTGPLGAPSYGSESTARTLPANARFVGIEQEELSLTREDGTNIPLQPVEGPTPPRHTFLFAPAMAPAGERLQFGSSVLLFSQDADTIPPRTPVLDEIVEKSEGEDSQGCAGQRTSCDGVTRVNAKLSGVEDDIARDEALVFAIYVGSDAEEAASVNVPSQWLLATVTDDGLSLFGVHAEGGDWVSVSAIDEAANESKRSKPRRVQ